MDVAEGFRFFQISKESPIEDFMKLKIKENKSPVYRKGYLFKQVLKSKSRTNFDVDNYIMRMMDCGTQICFFRSPNSVGKILYLTAPYFTMGLCIVTEGTEHVIQNLASSTPFYLHTCRPEKVQKYIQYTDANKALVNKRSIECDFQRTCIAAKGTHIVPPKSIYFSYAVTHSYISCEKRYLLTESNSQSTGYHFRNSNREPRSADSADSLAAGPSSASSVSIEDYQERNAELEDANRRLHIERQQLSERERRFREGLDMVKEGIRIQEIVLNE